MKNTIDEEYSSLRQSIRGVIWKDVVTSTRTTAHCWTQKTHGAGLTCHRPQLTHGSLKYERLLGIAKSGILKSRGQGIIIFIMLLVITMQPMGATADYYQRKY